MTLRRITALVATTALTGAIAAPAAASEGTRYREPLRGTLGVIATESPAATVIGTAILDAGGNAIDAAIATIFALNVARPQSCGIGGGGFLVYRSADGSEVATLDFREEAPSAFTPTTLQVNGINQGFSGHLVVGVPGTVSGMAMASERYGSMAWAELISPAAALAATGFSVPQSLTEQMGIAAARLRLFPASAAQFLVGGVTPYPPGSTLVQPDLAATLNSLAELGPDAFYTGPIAQQIVDEMEQYAGAYPGDDGVLVAEDLAAYTAVWREPLQGTYRDHEIIAMPPPTSGGVALLEILNLLEGFDLAAAGPASADHIHLVAEAQKMAWADRGAYLADPDFVDVPTALLTSKAYADSRRGEIDLSTAKSYPPGDVGTPAGPDGEDYNPNGNTTHLSVIDQWGNAVALTCTIEQGFGSGVTVTGAGFLLNNELTDFSGQGTANEPDAGKRPRSSISPTIVVKDGIPVLAVGGAGGATIIMGSVHATINTIDFGMDPGQAVDAERWDSNSNPRLSLENVRVSLLDQLSLAQRGHVITAQGEYNLVPRVQAVGIDPETGERIGTSDSRTDFAVGVQSVPAPEPEPEADPAAEAEPTPLPATGGGLSLLGVLGVGCARLLRRRS
jgi:gamma-glutamyltranspeptidase/glutathione hydrolase